MLEKMLQNLSVSTLADMNAELAAKYRETRDQEVREMCQAVHQVGMTKDKSRFELEYTLASRKYR